MRDMKSSSGFSIIEMMISFLTVGLVMLAVFELVNSFQGNYNVGQENTSLRQNLQVAMNIMLREIREAGNDPNNVNIVPVAIDPNADSINDDLRIQKDSNPPDDTQGTGLTDPYEDLTFAFDSTNNVITMLDNVTGGAPVPISDASITNLTFTLIDTNGIVTNSSSAATSIRIRIDGETEVYDPRTHQEVAESLTSEVKLRRR